MIARPCNPNYFVLVFRIEAHACVLRCDTACQFHVSIQSVLVYNSKILAFPFLVVRKT